MTVSFSFLCNSIQKILLYPKRKPGVISRIVHVSSSHCCCGWEGSPVAVGIAVSLKKALIGMLCDTLISLFPGSRYIKISCMAPSVVDKHC